MNDDKIAEIRKRHEDVAWRYYELPTIYEDRAFLLAEVDRLRAAATSAGAALAAAIELLERGPEDAPSKRMFSQMLADYRVIVARTRKALEASHER